MNEPDVLAKNRRYVLVMDAEVKDRFYTCMLLQRFGCNVFTAHTVEEAVEFMTVAPPSAIVADAALGGGKLITRVLQDPRFLDVPLILLSSTPDAALEQRARRGEIAAFFLKPLDVERFYRSVQETVEKGPRRNIRIETRLSVRLEDGLREGEGDVTVLSEYGMFFRTLEPRPVNARVPLSLTVKGKQVRIEAVVLYTTSFDEGPFKEPGMGMKFEKISRDDRNLIKEFILEELGKGMEPRRP